MTGTFFHLLARYISSFLLIHVLLLLLGSTSSSSSSSSCSNTMLVTAFTAPLSAAADIRRHRHITMLTSSSSSSPSTSPTALNVVTSRSIVNGASSSTTVNGSTAEKNGKHMPHEEEEEEAKIPFIIEQLPVMNKSEHFSPLQNRVFQEISEMCIDVFFNDNCIAEKKTPPIWKEVQLAYLRKLQQGDLRQRRMNNPDTNLMYIARQVVPVGNVLTKNTGSSSSSSNSHPYNLINNNKYNNNNAHAQQDHDYTNKPLVLDLSQVYNLPRRRKQSTTTTGPFELFNSITSNDYGNNNDDHDVDYVCGRVLGFVEVTLRPYGLGEGDETMTTTINNNDNNKSAQSSYHQSAPPRRRPILTNLAVRYEARGSGVGSCLLQTLEQGVLTQWKGNTMMNNKEIILEVEDDNENAIQFYQKRGYQPIFHDPASRRYDTNGLILRQMRCNRIIMRKNLLNNNKSPLSPSSLVSSSSSSNGDELAFLAKAFQRLKESVLSF